MEGDITNHLSMENLNIKELIWTCFPSATLEGKGNNTSLEVLHVTIVRKLE